MEVVKIDHVTDDFKRIVKVFEEHLAALNQKSTVISDDALKETLTGYFKPDRSVYGCLLNHQLIGYAVLKEVEGCFWLEWIFVLPKYRHQGFARALFMFCEREAIKRGGSELYVYVHPDNHEMLRFLKRVGYDSLNLVEVTKKQSHKGYDIDILGHRLKY